MRDDAEIRRFVKSHGDKVRETQAKFDVFDNYFGHGAALKRKDEAARFRLTQDLADAQHNAHVALLAFRHGMYVATSYDQFDDLTNAIKDAGYDFHTRTFPK